MMKSHLPSLCTFLSLFLILVAKPSSSVESSKFAKHLLGAKNGDKIEGLNQVRQYLARYGYMNPLLDNFKSDEFDNILTKAVKKYQHFFHLNSSGVLDENTLANMAMPRCGVPDFHYASNGSKYAFVGTKWKKFNLTWGLVPELLPTAQALWGIDNALKKWASFSKFSFRLGNVYYLSDIKFAFARGNHGDGTPFDGAGGVLAHARHPPNGNVHFDADEKWGNGAIKDTYDIQSVALHELGHALGLAHSNVENAIMYPSIRSGVEKGLGYDDYAGIKALYP